MQFDKTVSLPAPPDVVWAEVTDLAVLAACLPGARLESVDGDGRARGHMGVRVGSMLANFEGVAEVVERDDTSRRLSVRASGEGTQGTAEASIVATVVQDGDATVLQMQVGVDIAGPLARLGQGMAEPVVDRLVDRFAVALGEHLATGRSAGGASAAVGDGTVAPAGTRPSHDEPLDLGGLMLPDGATRTIGLVVGLVVALLTLSRLLRRPAPAPTIVLNLYSGRGLGPGDPSGRDH